MRIGIPKEQKTLEGRVGLIPGACAELVVAGHEVFVETSAGVLSGFGDDAFRAVSATICSSAQEVYDNAELIVKIKEPQPQELSSFSADHTLFCFLHLAAEPKLLNALVDIGLTAVGFETVEVNGGLPLLAPMSAIAGRIAVQQGTVLLHQPANGKGLLLGGVGGADRANVVIVGAGVAGMNAASLSAAMGANVAVFDKLPEKLNAARALGANVTTHYPYPDLLAQAVAEADIVIGAVLVPGAKAPHVISRAMVQSMGSGSVIADISVDQGGCVETTRPTTYAQPTYVEEGVTHFTVTNMPGAVPKTSSQAMSMALIPHVLALTDPNWQKNSPPLAKGINVAKGNVVHPAIKHAG